jgi:hypothetical protein
MNKYQKIAELITASEAERLAAGFAIGQPVSHLINIVNNELRKDIRPFLEEMKEKMGTLSPKIREFLDSRKRNLEETRQKLNTITDLLKELDIDKLKENKNHLRLFEH